MTTRDWIDFPYAYLNPGGRRPSQTAQLVSSAFERHGLAWLAGGEFYDQGDALDMLRAEGLSVAMADKPKSHNVVIFDSSQLKLKRDLSFPVRPAGIKIGLAGPGLSPVSLPGKVVGGRFEHVASGRQPALLAHHGQSAPLLNPRRFRVSTIEQRNVADVHKRLPGLSLIAGDYNGKPGHSRLFRDIRRVAQIDALQLDPNLVTFGRRAVLDWSSWQGHGFRVVDRFSEPTPALRSGKVDHWLVVVQAQLRESQRHARG